MEAVSETTQTPREIAFEDITKGDDIEARWERNGVSAAYRGIAHHRTYGNWYTEAGGLVAHEHEEGDGWQYYLHSRPAPEEPKGLGAVVWTGSMHVARWAEGPDAIYPWLSRGGDMYAWSDFDPDTIEVLSEGIIVEDGCAS